MKFKKILILLPVFALASCNTAVQLDSVGLKQRANQIQQSQEEITTPPTEFAYESEVTVTPHGEETSTYTVRLEMAKLYLHHSFVSETYVEGEKQVETIDTYSYVKDDEYVLAFKTAKNGQVDRKFAYVQDISFLENILDAEYLFQQAGSYTEMGIDPFDVSTFLGEIEEVDEYVEMMIAIENKTIEGYLSYDLDALSKGEGHLEIISMTEFVLTVDNESSTYKDTKILEWDNNLFARSFYGSIVTTDYGDETEVYQQSVETIFEYKFDVKYPNLEEFK